MKLQNIRGKGILLKVSRKKNFRSQKNGIRVALKFSTATLDARRQKSNFYKLINEKFQFRNRISIGQEDRRLGGMLWGWGGGVGNKIDCLIIWKIKLIVI